MHRGLLVPIAVVVIGLTVATISFHSPQLTEYDRCEIVVEPGAAEDSEVVSFDSLSVIEKQAVRQTMPSGQHQFACPDDPRLGYAGDGVHVKTIRYDGTNYTVASRYDDALFPYERLKTGASVITGVALIGAGVFGISKTIRS